MRHHAQRGAQRGEIIERILGRENKVGAIACSHDSEWLASFRPCDECARVSGRGGKCLETRQPRGFEFVQVVMQEKPGSMPGTAGASVPVTSSTLASAMAFTIERRKASFASSFAVLLT